MGYFGFIYYGISVDNYYGNREGYNAKLGKFESKILGVDETSKLGVESGCKETISLGVPNWDNEGIPEGLNIWTDLGNDEES